MRKIKETQAFVELVEYVKDDKLIFRLSELHSLYVRRLEINKTKLKISLLECYPDAQEQSDGKNISKMPFCDLSGDATILAKASEIIRKDIFDHGCFKFSGSFSEGCQENSAPARLTLSSRSYTSPCRAEMPTLRSSLVMKYNRTRPRCLDLANSACQLPSPTS